MSTFNNCYQPSVNTTQGSSAWEKFLRRTGVPESSCASHVASGTQQGAAICSWVRENYGTRYVPEHILEVLGLQKQLVLRWQAGEQRGTPYVSAVEAF